MANKLTTKIFIERARQVHGDTYDYSKVEYVNVFAKVRIICSTHGEFLQVARQHLKGIGCPECTGYNKLSYEACYEVAKQYQSINDFKNNEVGAYSRAFKNNWLKDYTWLINPAPKTSVWDYDTCYKEAQKYITRKQFEKGCSSAYKKAREEGWLTDYSWFVNGHVLEGQKRRKWNYDTCYEEAKKYNSRSEFQYGKGASCAYKIARKEGWLSDYTWFKASPKENGYWTKEQCYKEAKKYKYLVEFRHESASAYTIARRENWLDSYTWLIKKKKNWKYSECYELAKKYSRRSEYKNGCPSAYVASLENEWIDDYTWFQEKPRNKYWTQERCYEEAQKYKTKKEFASNSSAYSIACRNGWISDYTWLNDSRIDIIKDRIDCVYSYYFKETHTIYIGRTINRKDRDYQHIFQNDRDSVARYAQEIGCSVPPMIVLEDSLTLKEGQAQEEFWLSYYKDQGFNILNKGAVGVGRSSLGSIGLGKWTKNKCFEEAKKYSTKTEFKEGNGSAYSAARKKGWLNEYTWLDDSYHIYTEEECWQIAKTCVYKKELITKHPGIYGAAKRRGWLKDYTWLQNASSHPNIKWTYETCLAAAKECLSKIEFETKYSTAMNLARKNGWLKEYTWFSRPKASNVKWTYEACKAESAKYAQRGDFAKYSKTAYMKSWKNGWLGEFFPEKE